MMLGYVTHVMLLYNMIMLCYITHHFVMLYNTHDVMLYNTHDVMLYNTWYVCYITHDYVMLYNTWYVVI